MNSTDDPLLIAIFDKLAIFGDVPPERYGATKIPIAAALIGFGIADAFAGTPSRSASATAADKIVKTSLLMPLPVTSPPRSIMCRQTPRSLRCCRTCSASSADRNMRLSLAVMTMSPALRIASSRAPSVVGEGFGPRNTALDEHRVNRLTEHHGIALNYSLLGAQAFAFLCLSIG